jgi:hypothetical protein
VVAAEVTPLEKEMKGANADYKKRLSDVAYMFTVEVTPLEKEMKSAKVVYEKKQSDAAQVVTA